ncbi:MAG TPA: phosphatidylserine decarboxylase [Bacteroidetes bacterium]|nr:phosphatidylserine decarboxylase [Bacteroidota bacterium]
MGIFERILRFWIIKHILGPKSFSAIIGFISGRDVPKWLLRPFIRFYIWKYNIRIDEFDVDIDTVSSFTEFFIRKFKPGRRQFKGDFVSPAESIVTDYGYIENKKQLEVKGMVCKMNDFFYESPPYDFKSFAIFYLSPADYHRVHAPFDITINKIVYIPGDLYSVKPKTVEKKDTLYCDNRRVVLYGNSKYGKVGIILVGALIVGKIVLSFGTRPKSKKYKTEEVNIKISKGEEIGRFELGSTVIMLMEDGYLVNMPVKKGTHILLGTDLSESFQNLSI